MAFKTALLDKRISAKFAIHSFGVYFKQSIVGAEISAKEITLSVETFLLPLTSIAVIVKSGERRNIITAVIMTANIKKRLNPLRRRRFFIGGETLSTISSDGCL